MRTMFAWTPRIDKVGLSVMWDKVSRAAALGR